MAMGGASGTGGETAMGGAAGEGGQSGAGGITGDIPGGDVDDADTSEGAAGCACDVADERAPSPLFLGLLIALGLLRRRR